MKTRFTQKRIDRTAAKLRRSADPRIRGGISLGRYSGADNHDVILTHDMLETGFYGCGGARQGKTSTWVIPMGAQFIQRTGKNNGPIVFIDIKGDKACFQAMRMEAHRAGRKFKWFTNSPWLTSYLWNPLEQRTLHGMTHGAKSDLIGGAMGLYNGTGYGRLFFWHQGRCVMSESFARHALGNHIVDSSLANKWTGETIHANETNWVAFSFEEMSHLANEVADKDTAYGNSPALIMSLRQAGEVFHMNQHANRPLKVSIPKNAFREAIQIPDILNPNPDTGQYDVLYFFLRSDEETMVTVIAKLVLAILKTALIQHKDAFDGGFTPHKRPDVIVFVDEFQFVADENLKNLLSQGGSAGLFYMLFNQNLDQLKKADSDLRETILANCGNQVFKAGKSADMLEMLQAISGEKETFNIGYGWDSDGRESVNITSCIRPVIEKNRIIQMASRGESLCILSHNGTGSHYGGHPFFIKCPHRYSKDEYNILMDAPWPARSDEVVVPADYIFPGRTPLGDLHERLLT